MAIDTLEANRARQGDREFLAAALADTRAQTLRSAVAFEAALPHLTVPQRAELNPPLWELGHVGWFQEWWLARNPAVDEGARADPFVERRLSLLPASDALYDSSNVPHATRWSLDLPTSTATRDYLAQGLATTQASLRNVGPDCDSLYFYRLSLFHEDMHNEATIYMANSLGFAVPDMRDPVLRAAGICLLPAQVHRFGWQGAGFAFDNELGGREVALAACAIDAAPVTNARYAAFVEAGGYAQARFWSPAGNAWRTAGGADMPRFWRRHGSLWQQRWFGHWRELDPHASAANLNCFEAEAWCAWAGRRLPTEAEWECSATTVDGFAWGDVWEWTSDFFQPWPGFLPHPYRDYSAPWFGSRRVLRGASVATHARMRHPRYRNFFTPERNDVCAGFRSCAL